MAEVDKTTGKLLGGITGKGFVKGDPRINREGRPKGSISIKDRIRQILQDEPDTFEELCRYYMKDRKMRELMWKMLEGNPQSNIQAEHSGGVSLQVVSSVPEEE